MSIPFKWRRGTAAQVAAFTGAAGEVVIDTTNNTLVVQDGVTVGGFPVALSSSNVGGSATQVAKFTATAGQTVFNTVFYYVPNKNNLAVFINGSKQIATTNYLEPSSTIVTFLSGLNAGDIVEIIYNLPIAGGLVDASNVSYSQRGTGSVVSTIQTKLQESVSVKDFGAVGDGVTDDTEAFISACTTINPAAVLVGAGSYKISGEVIGKFYSFGAVSVVSGTVTTITNLVP